MDPVSLIVAAVAAGAATGTTAVAGAAIQDAYEGLRRALQRRLSKAGADATVLEASAIEQDEWERRLSQALTSAGAHADPAVVDAARRVMLAVTSEGADRSAYTVDLRHAKGVQFGDHGIQHNTFLS